MVRISLLSVVERESPTGVDPSEEPLGRCGFAAATTCKKPAGCRITCARRRGTAGRRPIARAGARERV